MAISFDKKINTIFKLLVEPKVLSALLSLRYSGFLVDNGWFESFRKKTPLDKFGNPVPWFTFSCNDFLKERLRKDFNIFEFGSGNSTLYFASNIGKVTSLEHNETWYKLLKNRIPGNAEIIFCDLKKNTDYSRCIEQPDETYNIIVVDGIERVNCLKNSVKFLKEDGVIILDDSEREEYKEGKEFLRSKGFKDLDFWGIAAGELYKKCTTIYYKEQNCLDI